MDTARGLHDVAVLIVDDIEDNLDLIEEYLEDEVWSVLRATGGEEAIRLAAEHRPDVALLDLMMPRMNGLAVLRTLRSITELQDMRIILQTAYADRDNVVTAQRLGCKHILRKPLERDRLLAELRTCLEGRPSTLRVRGAGNTPPPTTTDTGAALLILRAELEARGLLASLADPEVLACVSRLLADDSRIGQRLVHVANSPLYGGRTPVRSVSAAVVRIGMVGARELLRKASPAARLGLTLERALTVLQLIEATTAVLGEPDAAGEPILSVLQQLADEQLKEADGDASKTSDDAPKDNGNSPKADAAAAAG